MSPTPPEIAFLFDVDNTLLDNDRVIADLHSHLQHEVGIERTKCYWTLFEQLRTELGHADYLGALQRYRGEYPNDPDILTVSRFLLNYPFADRLFPRALEVIAHVRRWGAAAIVTDGDVVFQPRKVDRAGLTEAVSGKVLIFLHKEQELGEVAARVPAAHYVLFEDKLRTLTSVKEQWGTRVTTVFVRQGHYAMDPAIVSACPAADISLDSITEALDLDDRALVDACVAETRMP